jgi:hypothetical protein
LWAAKEPTKSRAVAMKISVDFARKETMVRAMVGLLEMM